MSGKRGKYQGAIQIFQYNRPFYLFTWLGSLVAILVLSWVSLPWWLRLAGFVGVGLSFVWSVLSLVVSYYVYDASGLYRWDWISGWFAERPSSWINIHAGLDESSPALKEMFPEGFLGVLDIYDPNEMTEPSIARARELTPPELIPTAVDYKALPIVSGGVETIFLLFAAHEVRRPEAREKFFSELSRALCSGGRLLIVEHLRDAANFLAFGPGCLHFLSRAEWLRVARGSGFGVLREESFTPFVRVFLLEKQV